MGANIQMCLLPTLESAEKLTEFWRKTVGGVLSEMHIALKKAHTDLFQYVAAPKTTA